MTFYVEMTVTATAEAEEAHLWKLQRSAVSAAKWYNGLVDAIDSLSAYPERCSLAPESETFGKEIRQLMYGKHQGTWRILFEVRGDTVYVLHIRHGRQQLLEP